MWQSYLRPVGHTPLPHWPVLGTLVPLVLKCHSILEPNEGDNGKKGESELPFIKHWIYPRTRKCISWSPQCFTLWSLSSSICIRQWKRYGWDSSPRWVTRTRAVPRFLPSEMFSNSFRLTSTLCIDLDPPRKGLQHSVWPHSSQRPGSTSLLPAFPHRSPSSKVQTEVFSP